MGNIQQSELKRLKAARAKCSERANAGSSLSVENIKYLVVLALLTGLAV